MTTPQDIAARLPQPAELERLSIALAALDALLSPEYQYRLYDYCPGRSGRRIASMEDGSGNDYSIVFSERGTVVRGFDHECSISPWSSPDGSLAPGLLDGFPAQLRPIIGERAFQRRKGRTVDLTFCAWQLAGADRWSVGSLDHEGGASYLFERVLDGTPAGYRGYATSYFGEDVGIEVIRAFFDLSPVDAALVASLDARTDVLAALGQMGYPVTAGRR